MQTVEEHERTCGLKMFGELIFVYSSYTHIQRCIHFLAHHTTSSERVGDVNHMIIFIYPDSLVGGKMKVD